MASPVCLAGLPRLYGPRLQLRELVPADAPSLFWAISDDPKVQRHISAPPPSITAFRGFIEWCLRQRVDGQSICFGVVPKGLEQPIGVFQIRKLGLDFSVAEWGFVLGSAFWSTGVFEEAASLVADFAFMQLGTFRLEGRAATGNGRGNGALLKLGASEEGILRRGLQRDDTEHDQFIWGLLAEEWQRRAARVRHDRSSEDAARKKLEAAIEEMRERLVNAPRSQSVGTPDPHPFFVTGRRTPS